MQTIVMSGVTRGIGQVALRKILETIPDLTVVLLARSASSLSWVEQEFGDRVSVHVIEAELNSIASTTAAAERVEAMVADGVVPTISALMLNAGVQHVDACTISPDGLEDTFAVNVVANHVLVQRLASHVRRQGRIVITVSDTHFGDLRHNLGMVPGPQWQDPRLLAQPGTSSQARSVSAGRTAYSTSKLAAIYQVHEYARRLPDVDVFAYNPGFVPGTSLARHAGRASQYAMARLLPLLTHTPLASSVDAAGADLADLVLGRSSFKTGSYINRNRAEFSSPQSYDPRREADLIHYLDVLVEVQRAQDD